MENFSVDDFIAEHAESLGESVTALIDSWLQILANQPLVMVSLHRGTLTPTFAKNHDSKTTLDKINKIIRSFKEAYPDMEIEEIEARCSITRESVSHEIEIIMAELRGYAQQSGAHGDKCKVIEQGLTKLEIVIDPFKRSEKTPVQSIFPVICKEMFQMAKDLDQVCDEECISPSRAGELMSRQLNRLLTFIEQAGWQCVPRGTEVEGMKRPPSFQA